MSDTWATALIELTLSSSILSPDILPELVKQIKELMPRLHENVRGQCRLMLKDIKLSDCCVSDIPRFDSPSRQFDPHTIKGSPFNTVIIEIKAPQKDSGRGLNKDDVGRIAEAIKEVLKSDPYKIGNQSIIVVPSFFPVTLQTRANK